MPKKVERCVEALKKKGTPEEQAWKICQAQYGDIKSRTRDMISREQEEEDDTFRGGSNG